jgi:hypothetical protein
MKKSTILSNEVECIKYMASLINSKYMNVVFSYMNFQNKYENQIAKFYTHSTWFKKKADELAKIYQEKTKGKHWVQFINEARN